MFNKSKSQFAQVLEKFSDPSKAKKLHKKAESLYLMRSFKVNNVSSEQAIQSYNRLEAKYESGELKADPSDWHKNERKLFIWFLICYIEERKSSIQELKTQDWELMGNIFFGKNDQFLKFQGLSILKNTKRHCWTEKDDEQLKKFTAEIQGNEWNQISKQIFFESAEGKFISAKQCRERWFNHICKEINKEEWTNAEDIRILKFTLEIGKKWSQIARLLGTHRTQHMVKNRFNSIINKTRRKKMENEEIVTKKALSMLEKSDEDYSQKSQSAEQKQKEMSIQRPPEKQNMVIEMLPNTEVKEEGVKMSLGKKAPIPTNFEADMYNLSDLAEGDLNIKDLKTFISKKQKGCFAFNTDESIQGELAEQFVLSMTPNSVKAISPGIPSPFYGSFDAFIRKDDGLFSPAPQSYSPMGFFSAMSPAIDMLSLFQRDKGGLNSSKQYFSSSLFTSVISNDGSNDTKFGNVSKKERKQMQQ